MSYSGDTCGFERTDISGDSCTVEASRERIKDESRLAILTLLIQILQLCLDVQEDHSQNLATRLKLLGSRVMERSAEA